MKQWEDWQEYAQGMLKNAVRFSSLKDIAFWRGVLHGLKLAKYGEDTLLVKEE